MTNYTPIDIEACARILHADPGLAQSVVNLAERSNTAEMTPRVNQISDFYKNRLNSVIAQNKTGARVDLSTLLLAAVREDKVYFTKAFRMIAGDQIYLRQKQGLPVDEETVELAAAGLVNTLVMIYPEAEGLLKMPPVEETPVPVLASPLRVHKTEPL